jgi:hypothetical protein
MLKLNRSGILNPLIIPVILLVIGFVAASVLAAKYYGDFTTQKNNNQPLIDAAVEEAKEKQKTELTEDFIEREKEPNKSYTSPAELGSVRLQFPKTWSSYVITGKSTDLDYFGHPNYVPADGVNYALRMSIVKKAFSNEVKGYDAKVKKGELKATSVRVSGVTGTRLDGLFEKDKEGSIVVFPLRDKTLRVWTESKDYRSDFDNIVLKNLSFSP